MSSREPAEMRANAESLWWACRVLSPPALPWQLRWVVSGAGWHPKQKAVQSEAAGLDVLPGCWRCSRKLRDPEESCGV